MALITVNATLAVAMQEITKCLTTFSDTARLDAELLLSHALNRPRSYIYAYPNEHLSQDTHQHLCAVIMRRAKGEPIAYILGEQEFWSLTLNVSTDTLIPRPETEHLIEWALENLPTDNLSIADLGTGSGAIAIALAHERPQWQLHATDTSAAALTIANNNAKHYNLPNIKFYLGSWYDALPDTQYDAIISNPPYIAENDIHLDNLTFEPRTALSAKDNGLADLKIIIRQAQQHLLPGGALVLEHGFEQASDVGDLLEQASFTRITTYCDLARQPRFTVGIAYASEAMSFRAKPRDLQG